LDDGEVATRLSHFYQPGVSFMKKTSLFSANSVAVAVAALCASMPAFAQVEAKVTGRVHFDMRAIDSGLDKIDDRDSASVGSNYELRRARIGITGSLNKKIQYEVVGNAVGSSTNFIDTAFINYGYNPAGQIRFGRFKQPFSLEENTSSNNIDFMERSYVNQITPGKKLGAMIHGANDAGFTYAASVYQNDFAELSNSDGAGTMGALRVTGDLAKLAKMGEGKAVVHLGLGYDKGSYEQLASASGNTSSAPSRDTRATIVSFRDENRGLSNAYRLQIGGDTLGSSSIASSTTKLGGGYGAVGNNVINVDKNTQGLELAVAYGPFKFQAESADSKFNANTTRYDGTTLNSSAAELNSTVKTQYVALVYNITGEDFAKSYSKGAFGGIKPASEFMKDYGGVVGNGTGAWQVGYRYSKYAVTVDEAASLTSGTTTYTLTDGSGSTAKSRYQNSPTANTSTYSLNWILNSNARVMFNYSRTKFGSAVELLDTDYGSLSSTTKEDIISVRTQINF
jgi:phosphate-selective porin OprO/OprP